MADLVRLRLRAGARLPRRHRGRAGAERQRRHDGRRARRRPRRAAPDHRRRRPPACSTSSGQTIPLLDLDGHRRPHRRRHGVGRHDRQAARLPRPRSTRGVSEVAIVHGRDPKGLVEAAGHAHHDGEESMSSGTAETTATSDIQAREARHVLQTYRRFPVAFVRGEGVRLFDAEGQSLPRPALGHRRRRARQRAARASPTRSRAQARELAHTSNLFFHPLQGQLADRADRAPRASAARSSATAAAKPTRPA